MIVERARVVLARAGGALVRAESRVGCARCAAGQGCGGAVVSRLLGTRLDTIEVLSDQPLRPDDAVLIGIEETALSRAAMIAYGTPLLGLLLGAMVGSLHSDWMAAVAAFSGLAVGLLLSRGLARGDGLKPQVLRRLAVEEACDS